MPHTNNIQKKDTISSSEIIHSSTQQITEKPTDSILARQNYLQKADDFVKEGKYLEAENLLADAIAHFDKFVAAQNLYDKIRARRSETFYLSQSRLSEVSFHIDTISGRQFKNDDLSNIRIAGWIEKIEPESFVVIKSDNKEQFVKFSSNRPDVIGHFNSKGLKNRDPICGFSVNVNATKPTIIYIRTSNGDKPVVSITPSKVFQVVKGQYDWLFLANDSNKSVDMFTGEIPVTTSLAEKWRSYAGQVNKELTDRGIKSCFVIAPSKEDVFPEFHPSTPAAVPYLDVISSSIFLSGANVSCPVRQLRQHSQSYPKTDTHWSDLGAWICVREVIGLLDWELPADFSPEFTEIPTIGDLGSKFSPARRSSRTIIERKSLSSEVIFNNKASGSGEIQIYRNEPPPIDKSVLIFGGSSATMMGLIMGEIFSTVTRINSPSTMPILEVIDLVKPDAVVMQTNGRYVRFAPKMVATIKESALAKLQPAQFPPTWAG